MQSKVKTCLTVNFFVLYCFNNVNNVKSELYHFMSVKFKNNTAHEFSLGLECINGFIRWTALPV